MTNSCSPKRRLTPLTVLLCLAPLLVSACVAAKPAPAGCSPLFEEAMVTEVYFGLSGPGGRPIPKKEWQAFLKSSVVAAFPDGFTVIPAQGYWRGEGMAKTAQENSLILKIIHPAGPEALAKLARIAKRYAKRFEQQAVLLSTTATDAAICN